MPYSPAVVLAPVWPNKVSLALAGVAPDQLLLVDHFRSPPPPPQVLVNS